jgi:hypothetical protein
MPITPLEIVPIEEPIPLPKKVILQKRVKEEAKAVGDTAKAVKDKKRNGLLILGGVAVVVLAIGTGIGIAKSR